MRPVVFSLALALLFLRPAMAAEGYMGRVSSAISLNQDFLKVADPLGRTGLNLAGIDIPPITGVIYFCGDKLRLDMSAPGGTLTTIVRQDTVYVLDHSRKVAWKSTQADIAQRLPLLNLEQFAPGWGLFGARLKATEGVRVRHLGSKSVNGQRCKGVSVTGDISRLLDAEKVEVASGLPVLYNLRGDWRGTFWISDELDIPMKINSTFAGISLVWQIAGLSKGDIPDALFAVPPGYRVQSPGPPAGAR